MLLPLGKHAQQTLRLTGTSFGWPTRESGTELAMDVLYVRCCGLDIHKRTVVACLVEPEPRGERPRLTATPADRGTTYFSQQHRRGAGVRHLRLMGNIPMCRDPECRTPQFSPVGHTRHVAACTAATRRVSHGNYRRTSSVARVDCGW
jgi:hypothetical protein